MFVERLLVVADDAVIQPAVEGFLGEFALDPASEAIVREHARSRTSAIRRLAAAMPEAEDEVELYRTVAAYWLELRFEWQRNNEIMNYQTVLRGGADPRVVVEGAIGSFMLSRLELCLDASHREMLTRYALTLLSEVRVVQHADGEAA